MAIKLFYLPGACSLAPHIVACEAGASFQAVKVDRNTKQTETGENFLEINPKGYVPALQLEDGSVLTEAQVVLQYLADTYGKDTLAPPPGDPQRYKLQEWLSFVSTELHKTIGSFFKSEPGSEWRKAMTEVLEKRLGWLDTQLQGREFVLDRFSVADAYLFTVLSWTGRVKFSLKPWPAVESYYERLKERPSVQQALKEEGLL